MTAAPLDDPRIARLPIPGRTSRFGVLMIASEVAPWAKTGGLADVLAGLPAALDSLGHQVVVVLPKYRSIRVPASESIARQVTVGSTTFDVTFRLMSLPRTRRVVFVDCPQLFDRDGYYGAAGRDFPDNDRRFALLSVAALDLAQHELADRIDVVHAHDWQAGLAPTWMRTEPRRWARLARAGLVFTIHNLAYQGLFPRDTVPALGLSWSAFTIDTGEFWSQFGFLKAGIAFSDIVTTVSPRYALETQQPAFGGGLDGVLKARSDRYVGILNGIDTRVWDPAADPLLPANFSAADLAGKRLCKRTLLERFQMPMGDDAMRRPVVAMVTRLVEQKGIDLVLEASESLLTLDATWLFLGTGEARFEEALRALAKRHPARVGVYIGFDETLAHLVEAGADLFLMPSRFEPCGLNQMYSLRYGTVPVVHAVGGLDDTIQPYTSRARYANGFKFREPTSEALVRAVQQALRVYPDREAWQRLMRQGMAQDHSWETSAREYVKVYRRARQAALTR